METELQSLAACTPVLREERTQIRRRLEDAHHIKGPSGFRFRVQWLRWALPRLYAFYLEDPAEYKYLVPAKENITRLTIDNHGTPT